MSVGNLRPRDETITIDDLLLAVERTHDLGEPIPPGMSSEAMRDIIKITHEANTEQGRVMGYGAILAWGIAIGVLAEQQRQERSPATPGSQVSE